ncbi:MAG: hypothetical protein M1823_008772, partial [Watsoniomyces obsoletus]
MAMTPKDKAFGVDLEDEGVRGSVVTHNGEILPPAPRPSPPPAPAQSQKQAVDEAHGVELTPWEKAKADVVKVTGGMGAAL